MNTHRIEPKIIAHLSPLEQMVKIQEWMELHSNPDFLQESFALFRKGMQKVLEYVEKQYPAALHELNHDVIVIEEPLFNAALDTEQKTYHNSPDEPETQYSGEVCVNIGVPMTLACLKPVLFYVGEMCIGNQTEPIKAEILLALAQLYTAWHDNDYPPPHVTSLKEDPALEATLSFIVAHEAGHFLLRNVPHVSLQYRAAAAEVFRQLLATSDFYSAAQIAQVKRIFQSEEIYDSWMEELAADILAYDICIDASDEKGRHDLMGFTTQCVIQAAYEAYLEEENIQYVPRHPYAIARLLAFEKHLQKRSGLATAEFKNTLDWLLPTNYLFTFCRVLQQIKGITWPDSNTYTASFHKVEFHGQEYLLFPEGELATVEAVKNFEFPYAHVFESGDVVRYGKKIGEVSDINILGEGRMRVDVDRKKIVFL